MATVGKEDSSESKKEDVKDEIKDDIVGSCYQIGDVLGSGTFGELRLGINLISKQLVAVKLESKELNPPQLELEYKFYQVLGEAKGIPRIYYFANLEKYNVLVMDLLGNTLDEMFQLMKSKFQIKTIAQLGIQMLNRIEYIHSKHLIYRDIKVTLLVYSNLQQIFEYDRRSMPQNFLLGRFKTDNQNVVHLIDFGLAKSYIDSKTNKHIPYKEHKCLTGTARYMSTNAHFGIEQSRRDDLQSIGYVLVYFCKGSLPWQGINNNSLKDKHRQIAELKKRTNVEELCAGLPPQLHCYMNYVKELDFFETPDYDQLRSMFVDLLRSISVSEFDCDFEWNPVLEETYRLKDSEQLPPPPQKEPSKGPELNQADQIASKEMQRIGHNKEKKIVRTISTTRLKDAEIK